MRAFQPSRSLVVATSDWNPRIPGRKDRVRSMVFGIFGWGEMFRVLAMGGRSRRIEDCENDQSGFLRSSILR